MEKLIEFLANPDSALRRFVPAELAQPRDLDREIRKVLSEAIGASPKSRQQIASEMTAVLNRTITTNMLNGFVSNGKELARFPAAFVPAFCQVTGDDRLQRMLLGPWLRQLLEIAECELRAARQAHQALSLRNDLLTRTELSAG